MGLYTRWRTRMSGHFKDLIAWQKSMDLAELVYAATERFPKREMYGLADQLRRAAVSVPSNIAEGQARFSHREFLHFLRNSKGSLAEVETQILIAVRLAYLSPEDAKKIQASISETSRILAGLISSIEHQGAARSE